MREQSLTAFARQLLTLVPCVAIALLSGSTRAHNTNTTHPKITVAALVAIEAESAQFAGQPQADAYAELSQSNGIYWGPDPMYSENDAKSKDLDDFQNRPFSVVAGAMLEDAPVGRVLTHFYDAYTGAGARIGSISLSFGDPYSSELVAHRYFDQAIEVFGYETRTAEGSGLFYDPIFEDYVEGPITISPAKEIGFFLFGHALHHVEDMSSIAHAQNDLHLKSIKPFDYLLSFLGGGEVDDYEASYLPSILWDTKSDSPKYPLQGQELLDHFAAAGTPADIRNFTDIWKVPSSGTGLSLGAGQALIDASAGLGRSVVNLTVFQGELDYLAPSADVGCVEDTDPSSASNARLSGEILEMFGTPEETEESCNIDFYIDTLTNRGGYRILGNEILVDGVPTASPGPGLYWSFFEPQMDEPELANPFPEETWWPISETGGPSVPNGGGEYYYIEQLMEGVSGGSSFDPAKLIRPSKIRANLNQAYDPLAGNDVVDNLPVPSGFGPVQPRSLVEMFAERLIPLAIEYSAGYTKFWYDIANTPPYLKKVRIDQDEEIRYQAEWVDIDDTRHIDLINERMKDEVPIKFNYVRERVLSITTVDHIDPEQPFDVIVEFNEPVQREPGDQEIKLFLNGTEITYSNLRASPPRPGGSWFENREYEMTVANLPADFPGALPEGEVTLTVQAYDRNYHRDTVDQVPEFGIELDQDPSTPARRQRINADQPRQEIAFPKTDWGQAKWGDYSWHDADSIDVEFEDVDAGGFAFDRDGAGDSTHVLLFDNSPPEATFEIGTGQ